MANTKKYVSLDKLSLYDEKIKKFLADADAAALASAKSYADGLAVNYDAAGTAATAAAGALSEAKAYADGKDAAIAEAKKAGTDAAAAASAAQGAADAAQAAADKAQGEVDALETLVGTLPEGATATNVVAYVQEKTSGIATEGAMTELSGRVTVVEGKVATIEGDYLKAADKTELEGKITAEAQRAAGVEGGLETRLAAVEADYLKGADKDALQGKIDLKADKTALEAEVERATGVEEGLQNQINLIMNNPDTKDVIDSIAEFTQYVADHGEIADGFRTDIDKNKDDIAAEVKRAGEAEAGLADRIKAIEDADHDFGAADDALKTELMTEINKKADAEATANALAEAVEELNGADSAMAGRLDAIEAQLGDGEGSVADMIAEAKQAAIDAAATDATQKSAAAETAAKTYADGLNTAMSARVDALEAIDHEHANKALLDTYTQTEANLADAVAKKHEHANAGVLDAITADKVTAWDAAEGNAKTYADGLNTAMNSRVATLETWHESFTECSEQEINDLFV